MFFDVVIGFISGAGLIVKPGKEPFDGYLVLHEGLAGDGDVPDFGSQAAEKIGIGAIREWPPLRVGRVIPAEPSVKRVQNSDLENQGSVDLVRLFTRHFFESRTACLEQKA